MFVAKKPNSPQNARRIDLKFFNKNRHLSILYKVIALLVTNIREK